MTILSPRRKYIKRRGGRALALILLSLSFLVSMNVVRADEPKTHTVIIEKFKFIPETLTIKTGDTVIWINKDIAPHTATAVTKEEKWDTKQLRKNQEASITFTKTGNEKYFCLYHPNMRGEIIVQ